MSATCGTCLRAALLLGGCLFLSAASRAGKISPPRNLSLTWLSEFEPHLSWAPPEHSMEDCEYRVRFHSREVTVKTNTWTSWVVMDRGFLPLSVTTECNGRPSEPAARDVRNPELVKSWRCYIRSRDRSYCSWEPAADAPHARFYYRLQKQGPDSGAGDSSSLRECGTYRYHDDGTRGCEIEAGDPYRIYIVVNATQNGSSVWNTFQKALFTEVRPAALNWTVHKTQDWFHISWSPPDVFNEEEAFLWTYWINYTECGNTTKLEVHQTQHRLRREPRCPYRIRIKAHSERGESPWSDEERFDADPSPAVYAAVVVPLLFACVAALVCACCRRNKENLFPKIPQPRDLLSDIVDNNNKSPVCNMYVPAVEEESCKITLVIDPQVNKHDR
ncbi:interleukin-13 receptor subunit alpha-1 [Betta splendens]|uniref:Interleukin-13 receptor subunit alpha-1 n=1 Tax=Betta splendens TaxID=158456 RepID=A0A6P7LTM0_BETSP|nr:interleukin-13 receptor subunit alpha-1 [Betta splendens]